MRPFCVVPTMSARAVTRARARIRRACASGRNRPDPTIKPMPRVALSMVAGAAAEVPERAVRVDQRAEAVASAEPVARAVAEPGERGESAAQEAQPDAGGQA